MNSKIWLSSPHMGGTEQKYVQEAFDTNWVAPLGPNVTGFEQDLQEYLKESHVAVLSSGTAALHLALVMLDVAAGDEVICQSMTFSASANPIAYQGAIPIFIDSEPETWNMCPVSLENAIKDRIQKGKKPKAIIVVDLYGMPAKMDELTGIAAKYEIPLIEDAAESLGSSYKGRMCGTFGEMSILSFNGNKIITTSGGGALVVRKDEFKKKAVFLSTQARDAAAHYQHSQIGYNYRMSNILAGIGRGQMEILNQRVEKRRQIFNDYKTALEKINGIIFLQELPENYSNRWLTTILVDKQLTNGISSEHIRLALEAENIESRPLWKPMHLQPVFATAPYYGNGVSDKLFEDGLCLPSGSNMSEEEFERIINVIKMQFS